jgi:hypothetical protein
VISQIFAFCLAEIGSFVGLAAVTRMTGLADQDQDFLTGLFERFTSVIRTQESSALSLSSASAFSATARNLCALGHASRRTSLRTSS